MRGKSYLFLAFKSFFHKKINIINAFLLIICTLLIIFSCSFFKTFYTFLSNSSNGNLSYRTLRVSSDYSVIDKKWLEEIDGVSYVISEDEYRLTVKTNNDEYINLYGVPNDFIKVNKGELLTDDEVIICPETFYLGLEPENYNKEFVSKLHDGSNYLGEIFTFIINEHELDYTVVGIFDNDKYTYGEYNTCFTSITNMHKLIETELENCEDCYISEDSNVYVIVDHVNDKDEIAKKIGSKYSVDEIIQINTPTITFILSTFLAVTAIILIFVFIILFILTKKFMTYNKESNLIYKAMGYSNKVLVRVNYLENLILVVFSFIISMIIVIIIYFIILNKYNADIKTGINIYISYLSILGSFTACLLISLLSTRFALKDKKKSIIEELDDCEI